MKNEICVLIADDNLEIAELLSERIGNESDIRIVGIAQDGIQALEMIEELKPDVVILDIIMPNMDGIGVLERLNGHQKPVFIILSAIGKDVYIQRAMLLGADYYIMKPFDLDALVSRVRQAFADKNITPNVLAKTFEEQHHRSTRVHDDAFLEIEITQMMHELCIAPHMMGYRYLREAVMETINNPQVFKSVTRLLYPIVANKFNTSPQKVERAIRNTIDNIWSRGIHSSLNTVMGYDGEKPSSSQFVAMIAKKVKSNIGL